jgi:hypothetical protein
MTTSLDPVRQQREILATFRRITQQRAQAESDAAARFAQENASADAALASAREEEDLRRQEAEEVAITARNAEYAAAEERYAQQIRDGESGVAAAQKQYEGALTVLGLADLRPLLSEARTVPVRLQPGQDPSQELRRSAGEAAVAASRLEALVDGVMAQRVEHQHQAARRNRRLPFFVVLTLCVVFLGYIGTRPCGPLSGVIGGQSTCSATLGGLHAPVNAVAYSPDGKTVAAAAADGTIHLWSAANHHALRTLTGTTPSDAIVFVAGGKQIAAAGEDGDIHLWDVASGRDLNDQATGSPVRALALSPDGSLLTAGGDDGFTALLPLQAKGPTSTLPSDSPVRAVAFSPDGKMIAAASDDGMVRFWHTADDSTAGTVAAGPGPVLALAFSPDGASIALGSANGTVALWNPVTGGQVRAFAGASGAVRGIAFSRDGARLIAAGDGKSAYEWDVKSGKLLKTIAAGTAVHGVALAPGGGMLALAGDNHTVLLRPAK